MPIKTIRNGENGMSKLFLVFALVFTSSIYAQGVITTPNGRINEIVPAGTQDFTSSLLKAKASGATEINFTSSNQAQIDSITQQAQQFGIKVSIVNPSVGETPGESGMLR